MVEKTTKDERKEQILKAHEKCLKCKLRCPHPEEEKHKCGCECKLQNLKDDCVHFIHKDQEYRP